MKNTPTEIENIIKKAFASFKVKTKIWDYDHKLRFKVYYQNNRFIETRDYLIRNLQQESYLNDEIQEVREKIKSRTRKHSKFL